MCGCYGVLSGYLIIAIFEWFIKSCWYEPLLALCYEPLVAFIFWFFLLGCCYVVALVFWLVTRVLLCSCYSVCVLFFFPVSFESSIPTMSNSSSGDSNTTNCFECVCVCVSVPLFDWNGLQSIILILNLLTSWQSLIF